MQKTNFILTFSIKQQCYSSVGFFYNKKPSLKYGEGCKNVSLCLYPYLANLHLSSSVKIFCFLDFVKEYFGLKINTVHTGKKYTET